MDKIRQWWKHSKLRDMFYNIKYGIQNLVYYFPIIWKTRDWDYIYIYEFLQFKIKAHREHLTKYGNGVNDPKKVEKMKLCELLLERLIKDDYVYSQSHWADNRQSMRVTYYHPMNTSKEQFDLVAKLETSRRNQDKKLLFGVLTRHIDGWWN